MSFPSVRSDPCHADLKARCPAPKQTQRLHAAVLVFHDTPGLALRPARSGFRADPSALGRLGPELRHSCDTMEDVRREAVEREPRTLQRASGHRIRADAASADGASRPEQATDAVAIAPRRKVACASTLNLMTRSSLFTRKLA